MEKKEKRAAPSTILIIDDDSQIRTLLSDFLGKIGYVVVPAKDARTALVVLGHVPVDLILLDLSLPDIYGLDLLPQLRGQYPSVPVVVISGYLTSESERHCFEKGAAAAVRKPMSLTALGQVIASTLERAGKGGLPGEGASSRRATRAGRAQE